MDVVLSAFEVNSKCNDVDVFTQNSAPTGLHKKNRKIKADLILNETILLMRLSQFLGICESVMLFK